MWTWIRGWEWGYLQATLYWCLQCDTCTHNPPRACPWLRTRWWTWVWTSRTGTGAGRRRARPPAPLGGGCSLPARSPDRGASGCSCCTDPCTAYTVSSPARPSPHPPPAARSETAPGLATGDACPDREGDSPVTGVSLKIQCWIYNTTRTKTEGNGRLVGDTIFF